jgi:hypothetical protein
MVLMRCLAKDRSERPANAAELLNLLAACTISDRWTQDDAARWWATHPTPANTD